MQIIYTTSVTSHELEQIQLLQDENHRSNVPIEIQTIDGFLTVKHSMELLEQMNEVTPHIIAKDGNSVIGYALGMSKDFVTRIPELSIMFEMIDKVKTDEWDLSSLNYIVMGQICIKKEYRGLGVFQGLYQKYFETYKGPFPYVVTEVALRNTKSLHAHQKVGFRIIHQYIEDGVDEWAILCY
ncbi:MAG TPA: GNAT family N-acetyltransferase [Saprospiraceae bacterium]|nr:GNAT family N-acetyltransferase [Saprospiraceae bacterium]